MDRARPWRTLTGVTLPLLMPNLLVVLVLAMIQGGTKPSMGVRADWRRAGLGTTFVVQFIYQTGFQEQIRLYGLGWPAGPAAGGGADRTDRAATGNFPRGRAGKRARDAR